MIEMIDIIIQIILPFFEDASESCLFNSVIINGSTSKVE